MGKNKKPGKKKSSSKWQKWGSKVLLAYTSRVGSRGRITLKAPDGTRLATRYNVIHLKSKGEIVLSPVGSGETDEEAESTATSFSRGKISLKPE